MCYDKRCSNFEKGNPYISNADAHISSLGDLWCRPGPLVETLRSDNGDFHEIDSVSLQTISPSSQVAQLLKRREFILELNNLT